MDYLKLCSITFFSYKWKQSTLIKLSSVRCYSPQRTCLWRSLQEHRPHCWAPTAPLRCGTEDPQGLSPAACHFGSRHPLSVVLDVSPVRSWSTSSSFNPSMVTRHSYFPDCATVCGTGMGTVVKQTRTHFVP